MTKKLRTSQLFTRWRPMPEQVDDQQRLENQLNEVTDSVEYGPVPGAYFPLTWNIKAPTGEIVPDGVAGSFCLPTGFQGNASSNQENERRTWSAVPVYIAVFIDRGQLDFAIVSESTKVPDGAAVSGFRLQQGLVIHETNVTLDINPNPVPPDVPWLFDFYQIIAPPPDPDLGIEPGICVRWEQTVDFLVSPVPDITEEPFSSQLRLQVVNVIDTTLLTALIIFKQLSKADNYRQG